MPVRNPTIIAVALAIGLAGCGGSSGGAAGNRGNSSAASPSPSERPLDAATAHRIAEAAQLKTADMPGYKEDAEAAGDVDAPDDSEKELQACISGTADPNYLADVGSSDFTKGSGPVSEISVGSETQVVATTAQGRQEFAVLDKPATVRCLNDAFNKGFATEVEGGTFTGTLKRIPSATPAGADGVATFVLDGEYKVQGVTVKMQFGFDLLLIGRAEVTLHHFSIGDQQLSAADRDRLRVALVTRAVAAQK
jgi:hypothetical protein